MFFLLFVKHGSRANLTGQWERLTDCGFGIQVLDGTVIGGTKDRGIIGLVDDVLDCGCGRLTDVSNDGYEGFHLGIGNVDQFLQRFLSSSLIFIAYIFAQITVPQTVIHISLAQSIPRIFTMAYRAIATAAATQ